MNRRANYSTGWTETVTDAYAAEWGIPRGWTTEPSYCRLESETDTAIAQLRRIHGDNGNTVTKIYR